MSRAYDKDSDPFVSEWAARASIGCHPIGTDVIAQTVDPVPYGTEWSAYDAEGDE